MIGIVVYIFIHQKIMIEIKITNFVLSGFLYDK